MLHKLSTSAKLWLLGIGATLAIALIGIIGMSAMSSMATQIQVGLDEAEKGSRAMVAVKAAQTSFLHQIQEWKNILIRGNDQESFAKHLQAFKEQNGKTQEHLATAIDLMKTQGIPVAEAEALKQHHAELTQNYLAALQNFDHGDPQAGKTIDKQVKGIDRSTTEGMTTLVNEIMRNFDESIAAQVERAQQEKTRAQRTFGAISLLGLLVIAVLSVAIRRELMQQLGGEPSYAAEIVQRIAQGDLTVAVHTHAGDQTSLLASMKQMQGKIHDVMGQIHGASATLVEASQRLAATSNQVASSSHQQSELSASMAAAIEEMSTSINQVADNSSHAHGLASQAQELSQKSSAMVHETIDEMNTIATSVQATTEVVSSLSDHSHKISGIANVIKEIADQTNLLALNAAIEAARAGDAGRGFAVVADEVRQLAEKTTASTQEISAMIVAIQHGTKEAFEQMAAGTQKVQNGVKTAAETGESMRAIETGAGQVLVAVDDIAAALREQSATSNQIARDVEQVAKMTEENSAAVSEVFQAATDLERLAASLRQNVSQFRV